MMMMAILASVMQCLGLLMPYFELAKRQGRVIGISAYISKARIAVANGLGFGFLTIDYSGAFFSLMALGTPSYQHFARVWLTRNSCATHV